MHNSTSTGLYSTMVLAPANLQGNSQVGCSSIKVKGDPPQRVHNPDQDSIVAFGPIGDLRYGLPCLVLPSGTIGKGVTTCSLAICKAIHRITWNASFQG